MFETLINQMVKIALGDQPIKTEFYNGTLFVCTIDDDQAGRVFHCLSQALGPDTVQVSPVGDTGEYAFDFVAKKQQLDFEEFSPFATANS
jgi:hypothetical protein